MQCKTSIGSVIDKPGCSVKNKTGSWRIEKPIWNIKKCTQCMICWQFCPDTAIPQKKGKRIKTDYDYCKGCGICVQVCPYDAIKMVKEEK